MNLKDLMDMNLQQIEARISELDTEVATLGAADATEESIARVKECGNEKRMLLQKKQELQDIEHRRNSAQHILESGAGEVIERSSRNNSEKTVIEKRADTLVKTGHMELRQLLSTGVLTPTAVKQEIGELPTVMSTIVDDVNAFDATGCGAWAFAYRDKDAVAAAVEEGTKIGGTPGTFKSGTIQPTVWGVLDEISNQVKKFTPIAYEQSVRNNAYLALRRFAKTEITKAILKSELAEKVDKLEIDQDFLRNLVLGYVGDESVIGGAKLYLTKATLQKIGKIRGTSEKKALYEITFADENNGKIKEGGLEVAFSLLSDLGSEGVIESGAQDVMIYGQMRSVDMPLWGNYEVETDEGGEYFARNMMAIRGLQTAGVGVTKLHTVQVINNTSAE